MTDSRSAHCRCGSLCFKPLPSVVIREVGDEEWYARTALSLIELDIGVESYETLERVDHEGLRGVEDVLF